MKKTLLTIACLFFAHIGFCQDNPYDSWNENYSEIELDELLQYEKKYADSIENNPDAVQFYAREDGYRFEGTFTGKWRDITSERINSMKIVHKIFAGEHPIFDQIQKEVEVHSGANSLWMPIQPNLEKSFKKEVKKNKQVYLYALYFNKHSEDGTLENIFFISEFIADR